MERRSIEAIWSSEADFFDRQADAVHRAGAVPDETLIDRYAAASHIWFNKEYRFHRLGDLRGMRVLDVGCGLGDNAILLAARGAEVTGVDLSRRSIDVALERAARLPLPVQPTFVCAPLEQANLPEAGFDVIWGDGFLHHVLHDLDAVLARLTAAGRDGALALFSEPVDRVPGMRALRLLLPVALDGTPDERPMTEADLAVVRRHLPDLSLRTFSFLGRVTRFVLRSTSYEAAGAGRRALVDALALADFGLLALPGAARLGGIAVLTGTVRRASPAHRLRSA